MTYFKFIDSEFINTWLEGSLRIGNAGYYRLLEIATNDEWIGDREECQVIAETGPVSITPENRDPSALRMLEDNGIANVPPGATFIIQDSATIIHSTDCYILSLCTGDIDTLRPIMTDTQRVRFAYNGCVEFIDPEALCRHLYSNGIVNGRPFSEIFDRIELGHVKYYGQDTDPWNAEIRANPFLKSGKYEEQFEYRLVFYPRERGLSADHITINFTEECQFVREGFRNQGASSASLPQDTRGNLELIEILEGALRAIENNEQRSSAGLLRNMHCRETFLEQDRIRNTQFEGAFIMDHLENVIKAYWALRCRGYVSAEMDRLFDPFMGLIGVRYDLSEYISTIAREVEG